MSNIVLEFRPFKRLDDKELLEKTFGKIKEIKQIPYEYDEYRYMLQMTTLNSLIKETKLRGLVVEKDLIIKNIFIDWK